MFKIYSFTTLANKYMCKYPVNTLITRKGSCAPANVFGLQLPPALGSRGNGLEELQPKKHLEGQSCVRESGPPQLEGKEKS